MCYNCMIFVNLLSVSLIIPISIDHFTLFYCCFIK